MPGYVFISNSTKPTFEQQNSRDSINLTNENRPCLKVAIDMGYEVFLGVNRFNPSALRCELPIKMYDSHTYRSILNFKDNKIAYYNLKELIINNAPVDVIHCNTPIGGMIGRLIGKKYHIKKVIYTAHGFHFFKGAPFFNNTILKLAERIMAHWTDAIITMNEEDYQAAQKFKLKKNGKVFKVHGVGITLNEYANINVDVEKKRSELGLNVDDFVCIAAGDLVPRKNYSTAIRALSRTPNNIHFLICGEGPEKSKLEKLVADLHLSERVHFLGYRNDVNELMKISDLFLYTTLQEGLPRALMEAMACGLPCVVSNIRGNVDLLEHEKGGYLCSRDDDAEFSEKIIKLAKNKDLREKMKMHNLEAIKAYDISVVEKEIDMIYREVLEDYGIKK